MVEKGKKDLREGRVLGGVVFKNVENKKLPKVVSYKLRFSLDLVFPTYLFYEWPWNYTPSADPERNLKQLSSGQIYLMDLVEKAIIKVQSGSDYREVGLLVQQFPTPIYLVCSRTADSVNYLFFSLITAIVVSLFITVSLFVYFIVYEKESGIKFYLCFYNAKTAVRWLSWAISGFLILGIIIFVPLILTCVLLSKTDIALLIFVFASYLLTTLAFTLSVSTCFYDSKLALVAVCFFFLFSYLPCVPLAMGSWGGAMKIVASLFFHNITMGLIVFYFVLWEYYGVGGQWVNLFRSPLFPDMFSIGHGILLLYINAILYILVGMYLNQVFPGPHFVEPGFFFSCRKLHRKCKKKKDDKIRGAAKSVAGTRIQDHQPDPSRPIELFDVRIEYPSNTKKEPNLSYLFNFHCYSRQVTSVLGTPRTWKSSALLAVCGLIEPKTGSVYFKGEIMEPKIISRKVGFTPQFLPLFDNLTVRRNLWFYGALQDMDPVVVRQASEDHLKRLKISKHLESWLSNLTYDDKRKVALILSVLSDPEIIVIDEPSRNVTLKSEREILSFLFSLEKKSMLIATSNCNEAALLSYKIVVVSASGMNCIGSPPFIRKILNSDPVIILYRKYPPNVRIANEHYLRGIDRFMAENFKDSKMVRDEDMEIVYRLSKASAHGRDLAYLLDRLTKNRETLLLTEFVLLNSCSPNLVDLNAKPDNREMNRTFDMADVDKANTPDMKTAKLHLVQFAAVFLKNLYSTLSIGALVVLLIVPICLMITGVLLFRFTTEGEWAEDHELELYPWQYRDDNLVLFAKNIQDSQGFMGKVAKGITDKPYFSTACVSGIKSDSSNFCDETDEDSKFSRRRREFVICEKFSTLLSKLKLSMGRDENEHPMSKFASRQKRGVDLICSIDDGPPPKCKEPKNKPTEKELSTGDTLLNMGKYDIADFVLRSRMDLRFEMMFGFVLDDSFSNPYKDYDIKSSRKAHEAVQKFLLTSPYLNKTALGWPSDFMNHSNHYQYFTEDTVTIWWENKAFQILPIAVNSINNVILRAIKEVSSDKAANQYGIIASLHSWIPYYYEDERFLYEYFSILVLISFIAFVFSLVPSYFLYLLVCENVTGSKHLQFISGLNMFVYWFSTYLFHYVSFLIPAIICIVGLAIVSKVTFLPAALLLLFMFGFAIFPAVYIFTPLFVRPGIAMTITCAILYVEGVCLTGLSMFLDANAPDWAQYIKPIFMMTPMYCLCGGLLEIYYVQFKQVRYDEDVSMLAMGGIGLFVLFLLIDAVVYSAIVVIIEYVPKLKRQRENRSVASAMKFGVRDIFDDSIQEEKTFNINVVDVKKMSKAYTEPKRKCIKGKCIKQEQTNFTIRDVTFSIPPWTCLGLYGDSDSGKSTIAHILSGKTNVTSGKVLITGKDFIKFYRQNANRKMVGFCAEDNEGLHPDLTVRQELVFYGRIRGITSKHIKKMLNWILIALDLKVVEKQTIWRLGRDEQRKVSVAIALIGNSKILIIDEPFSDISPKAAKLIKNALQDQIKSAKALMITSRVMENIGNRESKSLIDSFMVLANKGVRFRGNRQHMLQLEGSFFLVTLFLENEPNVTAKVLEAFEKLFPDSKLLELYPKYLVFKLEKTDEFEFIKIFENLDLAKRRKRNKNEVFSAVKDFYISDPTVADLAKYALVAPYRHDEEFEAEIPKNDESFDQTGEVNANTSNDLNFSGSKKGNIGPKTNETMQKETKEKSEKEKGDYEKKDAHKNNEEDVEKEKDMGKSDEPEKDKLRLTEIVVDSNGSQENQNNLLTEKSKTVPDETSIDIGDDEVVF